MQSSTSAHFRQNDFKRATQVVTLAFTNYVFMQYITLQAQQRSRFANWFGAACARYGLLYGRVDTTDSIKGVAVWLPPCQTDLTPWRLLHSGFLSAPMHVPIQGLMRFVQSNLHMEREHKRFAGERHWYLLALGVDPQYQGQGIGSQVIQPAL